MPIKHNRDDMLEAYIDEKEGIYDYGTAPYNGGGDIVDTKHTGMSFYDQFLGTSELDYLHNKKNLKGDIVMMSPQEYYEECAYKIFNTTVAKLKRERGEYDRKIIDKLHKVLTVHKRKLCLPMLNYAEHGQEGLHRMLAIAEVLGWDHKVPVLVVDWYDKERHEREVAEERQYNIDKLVERAITETLHYQFTDLEDLTTQLQSELVRQFKYENDVYVPSELDIKENDEAIILTFINKEYPIDRDEIRWRDNIDDELDVDDLDLETDEEFLVKYFGKDWRTTHPYLKDTFNIRESYEHNLTTKRTVRYNENDISPFGYKVDFYKDDVKVGTASICGVGTDDPYLYDFVVEPEHLGNGYANDMMQHMIDEYDALHLYVNKDNYKAINLYKKFGWNIVGEAPEQDREPAWEMGRFETDYVPNLEESMEEIDKETIIRVLEEHNHCYYQNTSMVLECICEKLYYDHNIDARYRGRSIYVGETRVATIKVDRESYNKVSMYDYILFI